MNKVKQKLAAGKVVTMFNPDFASPRLVEYMPWSAQLFEEVPLPVKGELVVPDKPGLGLNFNRDAISRFGVRA